MPTRARKHSDRRYKFHYSANKPYKYDPQSNLFISELCECIQDDAHDDTHHDRGDEDEEHDQIEG